MRCNCCVFVSIADSGSHTLGNRYAGPSDGTSTYNHAPTIHIKVLEFMKPMRMRRSTSERKKIEAMLILAMNTFAYVQSKKRSVAGVEKMSRKRMFGEWPKNIA